VRGGVITIAELLTLDLDQGRYPLSLRMSWLVGVLGKQILRVTGGSCRLHAVRRRSRLQDGVGLDFTEPMAIPAVADRCAAVGRAPNQGDGSGSS